MKRDIKANEIKVIGIDLAKNSLHVHGVDKRGRTVLSRKVKRRKLAELMANMPPVTVGMEACGGAHHWARKLRGMGHEVHLIAAQFVKPYVKSNKSDAADAEGICEAVSRPSMRFVPIKSIEQQDIQSLHRIRSMAVSRRTAHVNQIRGLLAGRGVVVPKGVTSLRKALPAILEDADNEISGLFRDVLAELYEELRQLDRRVRAYDARIRELGKHSEACGRLMTIPGVGPLTATALVAAVGDASVFKSGREMAAWLGLVPRQHSTGGTPTLLGISKRGDSYVRKLLIDGARSALRWAGKKSDRQSRWVCEVEQRRGRNIATVALANKNARAAWALLSRSEEYVAVPAT